ncbi:MAG: two pore domain potassium channel family protein [Rhizobiales bacterium]|nr:two pore domain potassium channel family protein [Hyphomicrobiales bacterium]
MAASLSIATLMVMLTVVIHFAGLIALMRLLEWRGHHLKAHESVLGQGLLLIIVVLGLVAIHSVEIWAYALLYFAAGAVGDFEASLYFSTVAFSSLGYGDIVLGHEWRLVSAIEAVNGLILIGWSTAFLLSLMGKLRALEHEWLERRRD